MQLICHIITFLKTVPEAINYFIKILFDLIVKAIEYTIHFIEENKNFINSNELFVLLK